MNDTLWKQMTADELRRELEAEKFRWQTSKPNYPSNLIDLGDGRVIDRGKMAMGASIDHHHLKMATIQWYLTRAEGKNPGDFPRLNGVL